MSKFKYNSGDKLGKFDTVLVRRTMKEKDWHYKGIFKCSFCGKEFETRIANVARNNTCSCGCWNKITGHNSGIQAIVDLSNKRFGKLIALYPTKKRTSRGDVIWYCQCDCGGHKEVSNSDLQAGKVKSCGCNYSKGEHKIQKILEELPIEYESQKTFEKCINPNTNAKLRFDFYLPKYNICIEYDGIQHFEYTNKGWNTKNNFTKICFSDKIKNKYCQDNNIRLIRIPYTEYKNIDKQFLLSKIEK